MAGRLTLCATPIGNLDDLTPRVRSALAACDLVACEDTRRTGQLLHLLGIDVRMTSIEAHREESAVPDLLRRLAAGEHVCLVTDAGMPLVSDPGGATVRAAIDAGIELEVLPGADAVTTALVAAGLPTKLHEEIARGSAAELAGRFAAAPKGEIVLVLAPVATEGVAPAAIESAVAELRERGLGAKDAARIVAGLTGRSARDLYRP